MRVQRERLAKNDERWRREESARERARPNLPRMQIPGDEGFEIR
jgi:hypothetical protein